jgi:hypothetical protein
MSLFLSPKIKNRPGESRLPRLQGPQWFVDLILRGAEDSGGWEGQGLGPPSSSKQNQTP